MWSICRASNRLELLTGFSWESRGQETMSIDLSIILIHMDEAVCLVVDCIPLAQDKDK